jgi:flagellar biosynthesis/type III secretory pathway M-ring protein FliF/YscJ
MEQLRDIKGIVEVHDTSLWQLLVLVLLLLAIAVFLAFYLKRKMRKKRRFRKTEAQIAKERIDAIDYNDPKNTAYTFIEDVAHFVDEENKTAYDAIVKELEPYKYKREVPPLDASLKARIEAFIKGIKWNI